MDLPWAGPEYECLPYWVSHPSFLQEFSYARLNAYDQGVQEYLQTRVQSALRGV